MFTKMAQARVKTKRPDIAEEIGIPENIQVNISGANISVKGPKGELKKELTYPGVEIKKDGSKIVLRAVEAGKKKKAVIGSFVAHLNNMFKGVASGFKYKLKIVFSHFPITAKVSGNKLEITNFLGEKSPRRAVILPGVKVNAGKDEVIVEGVNIEDVGQTAANIEQITRVKHRDTRVFQDGVYLVSTE